MNLDCFSVVSAYMPSIEAARLSRKHAVEHLPTSVVVENYASLQQFLGWCGKFDTSNVKEVTINMKEEVWSGPRRNGRSEYPTIGWVPQSVKKLTINDHHLSLLEFSEGIEELVIESSLCRHLDIPSSVRKLTLGRNFCGTIRTFPEGLEELQLLGWDSIRPFSSLGGVGPDRICHIPDTVRVIEIGPMVPVVITRWPEQLESLTLARRDFPFLHAEISEEVDVYLSENPVVESTEELSEEESVDFSMDNDLSWDVYEDARTEMWYL